jgi:hypothetical protein
MQYVSIGLILVLTSSCRNVNARCSSSSLSEALEGAKAVFVGKVISVEDPGLPADDRLSFNVINLVRPIKVHFEVERVYRGLKATEIEVATKTGGLEFGYDFKVGEQYLVYAEEDSAVRFGLIVQGCGRTRPVKEATEDIRSLNSLVRVNFER